MYLTNDFIYPATLTGYVRQALSEFPQNQFTLARWLPNQNVADIQYRFASGGTGLADAAVFRTYDAESPLGRRQGIMRVTGELPPISLKTRLSEYDNLRIRNGALNSSNQEVVRAILNDGVKNARSVEARMEFARGEALSTGQIALSENGVTATVNFNRAGAMAVTAATLWSTTATADPFGDLDTWRNAYVTQNGVEPGAILMSRSTLALMRRSTNVAKAVFAGAGSQPTIVSQSNVNDTLEAFGLPPMYIYYAQANTYAGTATAVLPANKVFLLPAPVDPTDYEGTQLGATFWGTTAESQEPEYGIEEGDQPGIVVGSYKDNDPVGVWTKAAAIGLPIMANPNLAMACTVA
jgi:hypothetical protein